jgi:hypothetical protein
VKSSQFIIILQQKSKNIILFLLKHVNNIKVPVKVPVAVHEMGGKKMLKMKPQWLKKGITREKGIKTGY